MRLNWYFLRIAVACAVAGAPAFGQALAEHAAAASGGSAAGAAGKTVSQSVTKVFGGIGTPLDRASQTGGATTARSVPKASSAPEVTGSAAAPTPAPAVRKSPRAHAVRVSREILPPANSVASSASRVRSASSVRYSAPPIPVPTTADFKKIRLGATRLSVVSKLGPPSDGIQIPEDDGHLTEVMHYAARGADLGTVRMSDGVVTEVRAAN
ncbi:MAG: hypothetical protein ABI165_17135 [Bryobacteraceae bacterium]